MHTEKRPAGATLARATDQVPEVGTLLKWGTVSPGAQMPRIVTLVCLSLRLEIEALNDLNQIHDLCQGTSL